MISRPIYYIQFFNLIIRFYTVLSSGDATTHSIANALNVGFLNAEKEAVLLVERTMMKVDDFKSRNLKKL
jgi:hypothetical protein